MSRSAQQLEWSCLRRYVGLRINLFRAMYARGFFVSADRTVIALPRERFALVARAGYSSVRRSFYVRECQWYDADLERLADDAVPDEIREDLLGRFAAVLN